MICKGNTHKNGIKLARYITTAKEGERCELWQLAGFAPADITDAFRSVHVIGAGTHCEHLFFHVQVRNPEGEELSRDEWRRVADRIEAKLRLTGQPRAIAFHTNQKTGHEHMHIAWSRIDADTMMARPLPYFKLRLKEVARELEKTLDLTRVTNERESQVRAPSRNEFEQARRLGVDIDEVRQTIKQCWDRSDNCRSFRAALADEGLTLAQGDRRDFVVIDHQGGLHALGKRVLAVSATETRERLADISRDDLPTVAQARELARDRQLGREKSPPVRMPDPHRDEMAWHDALTKAAIEKEKIERRFVNPTPGRDNADGRKKEQGSQHPPEHLKGIPAEIWTAYNNSGDANEFADTLEPKALLARVTKDEADRSYRQAAFAKEIGRYVPVHRAGDIVIVTEPGNLNRRDGEITQRRRVFQLNRYTTGQDRATIENFLAPLDRRPFQGIEATKAKLNVRSADRAERSDKIRLDNAQRRDRFPPGRVTETRVPAALKKTAGRTAGKALDAVGNALESLLAPVLTPEQKREAARTMRERAADAAEAANLSSYLAEREQARQTRENEQEAARQRQRDGRDR
jgi:hypothetical protein